MRTTRKQISAEILRQTGYHIGVHGSQAIGVYHFYSDDPATALMLASFEETSVYVFNLSDFSVDRWADEFVDRLNKYREERSDRQAAIDLYKKIRLG
ncbi:MAG: hypothetical protein ACYSO0_00775 [Planctomycetota bacterium]|jgi:hypothetical protein